jgi:hypothetical protein
MTGGATSAEFAKGLGATAAMIFGAWSLISPARQGSGLCKWTQEQLEREAVARFSAWSVAG